MTLGTKQLLGVHKIIRSREIDASNFLTKHLFHSEPTVVNSALLTLKKLNIKGLSQYYENLFKGSGDTIRCKILENIRAHPKYEFKDFLLNIMARQASHVVKEKAILAMGALAGKGEIELLNDLRDRIGIGTSSDKICEKAIEALFQAGDFEHLSSMCLSLISVDETDWRARKILEEFGEKPHKGSFLKFYKYFKKINNPVTDHGYWILRGLFGSYEKSVDTENQLIEIKEWLVSLSGSDKSEEAEFACNLLGDLDMSPDKPFIISTLTTLVTAPLHTPGLEQKRSEVFQKFMVLLGDECGTKLTLAMSMAMDSVAQKTLEILERKHREKCEREGRPGGEERTQFLDFFESLGHQKIVEMVVNYLKSSPVNREQRNTILSVLTKLKATFSTQQKQRLAAVVKLLMDENNRSRAVLAVDCSKINFDEAIERIVRRIRFLSPFMGPLSRDRLWEVLVKIYKISKEFPGMELLRRDLLQPLLESGKEPALKIFFENILQENEIFQEKILQKVPKLVLYDLNFLKLNFGKSVHSVRYLKCVIQVLKGVPQINDPDWMRVLIQMEAGSYGQLTEELSQSLQWMICSSDGVAGLQYLSQKAKDKKYQLVDFDLKLIQAVAEALANHKSKQKEVRYLKDLIFGVLKEGPESLKPELCVTLNDLEEEFGQVNILQYLESQDRIILSRAIEACKKMRFGKPWKKIFYCIDSEDFLIQNAVVTYFERDYQDFTKVELKRIVESYLEGERESMEASLIDQAVIDRVVSSLEASSLENTSTFGRDQNMKELTIFFIDIAGYTKRSNTSNIGEVMTMLEDFGKIIEPIGLGFKGNLIKKIGDCFMYTFDNRLGAILFSLEVQKALKEYNEFRVESEKLRTRIGLNTGKVYIKEGDVYGDPVNTASRVESKAPLDGTLANETTFLGLEDLFHYEKMEPIAVKGIDVPLQTYHVQSAKAEVLESYLKKIGSSQLVAADGS